jgi:hypothetical protein
MALFSNKMVHQTILMPLYALFWMNDFLLYGFLFEGPDDIDTLMAIWSLVLLCHPDINTDCNVINYKSPDAVCVCVYIYIYIYIYIHTYILVHTKTHRPTQHQGTCSWLHCSQRVYIYTYIYIYIHTLVGHRVGNHRPSFLWWCYKIVNCW